MSLFSTDNLISVHPRVLIQIYQSFFLNFHIKISYGIIHSLNFVVDQLFLNIFLWLLNDLAYSFMSMDFSCFIKNANFNFYLFMEIFFYGFGVK